MKDLKQFLKLQVLRMKFQKKDIKFAKGCKIAFNSSFEGKNRIGEGSYFNGDIGYASYIGENCHIIANIGKFTCIASRVITARGTHPVRDFVSIHPAFYSLKKQSGFTFAEKDLFDEVKAPITIGNDVWIGDSALICDGVKIGDGAVIAAGAVVAKDVDPYTIVGGVPARVIRKRFTDNQIELLLDFKWWDKSYEWLNENYSLFSNIEDFEGFVKSEH